MSIDVLQEKIRKTKCPVMLEFAADGFDLPPHILSEALSEVQAYDRVCRELLDAMKGTVPAVRVSFASFSLLGPGGLESLSSLLRYAHELGYYVVLDAPEILGTRAAERTARILFSDTTPFPCDALILSSYLGSDCIKPFLKGCEAANKDIFIAVRTANRSASELQDLLAGGRLVHIAAADLVRRCSEGLRGKCGYSPVSILCAANAPDSIRSLRSKYPAQFLLVDGYSAVGANAKICSLAFDKFGHGAVVCGGGSILRAWQQANSDGTDYLQQSQAAVDRMKRNLLRYITIL